MAWREWGEILTHTRTLREMTELPPRGELAPSTYLTWARLLSNKHSCSIEKFCAREKGRLAW